MSDAPVAALALEQARSLVQQIANQASAEDRLCYHAHNEFNSADPVDPEHVFLELNRLRAVINHLGWLADLATAKLDGHTGNQARGDAEHWLVHPVYAGLVDAAALGTKND